MLPDGKEVNVTPTYSITEAVLQAHRICELFNNNPYLDKYFLRVPEVLDKNFLKVAEFFQSASDSKLKVV